MLNLLITKEKQIDPIISESLKFVILSEEIDKQNERYDRRKNQKN